MSSQWEMQLSSLKAEIENKTKQVLLLEQLIALEAKHVGSDMPVVQSKVDRSSEKINQNHENSEEKPQRRPRGRRRKEETSDNTSLPELLTAIGQQHTGKKIPYKELAEEVLKAGYKTDSSNFNNMVYQSLQKLVKRGLYTKDPQTREYEFVGE